MKPHNMTDDELIREIDAEYGNNSLVSMLAVRFADAIEVPKAVEEFETCNGVDFTEDADAIQRMFSLGEELDSWLERLEGGELSAFEYLQSIVERYEQARLWVCQDCLLAIANDDYSGLDYDLPPEIANRRAADIRSAIAKFRTLALGDGELDFSTRPCDCCIDYRHGSRYAVFDVDKVP